MSNLFPARSPFGSRRASLRFAALLVSLVAFTRSAAAVTYYVDGANAACSDAGTGTAAAPFCHIAPALTHGGPGVTVTVMPGLYRERLTVPVSGAVDQPFVIQAQAAPGAPVVLDGADPYDSPALWTALTSDVWRAASVTVAPKQVFVGDARLAVSTAAPDLLPPQSFRWIAGEGLYVNAGGGNPGLRAIAVGARSSAFRLTTRSWVEVRGFDVRRYDDKGIYLLTGTTNVVVAGNRTSLCASNGIGLNACSDVRIEGNVASANGDHGISLLGSTRCRIARNESFGNARPTVRAATGIYLFGSTACRIEANRVHHNQDSGMEMTNDAGGNLSLQNRSWSNGDHGFDNVLSVNNTHLGDVAWGNYKDGFSIEGNATANRVANCIAVENGVHSNEVDLYVDPTSMAGFQSDYNVFWNSGTAAPVKVNNVRYSTVASYVTATGLDLHSDGADPRFVDPSAGNFELRAGSSAIDAADASIAEWPATDVDGRARIDVLNVPDRGAGAIPYVDRGAFEFRPAPVALAAPASITVAEAGTLTVTVQAGDSTTVLRALTADFSRLPAGRDAVFQFASDRRSGTLTWHPTYRDSGAYVVTFVAVAEETTTASMNIRVLNVDRAPVISAPATFNGVTNRTFRLQITAADPDGDTLVSLTADLTQLKPGPRPTFVVSADHASGVLTWAPDKKRTYPVTFTARNALTSTTQTQIVVTNRVTDLTPDDAEIAIPASFDFRGPYPNPTRGSASFRLDLPADARVQLDVFDLQGRLVGRQRLELPAGTHAVAWDGRDRAGARAEPGVYVAILRSTFEAPRRLTLLLLR